MIRKSIKETIKDYFFMHPTEKLRVRHIERTLQLPLPSVIRYCKELKKEDILTITKIGNITFYTANRTHATYTLEKKLFNIKQLHESGLLTYLREALNNPVIVLFGSYANGEDTESSDVDIYIETPSKKEINVKKYEQILQRKIQTLKHKNIKQIQNIHLANNIVNGITLNNSIEVF